MDSVWLVKLYVKVELAVPFEPTSSRVAMFSPRRVQLGTLLQGSRAADIPRPTSVIAKIGRIVDNMLSRWNEEVQA